MLDLVQNPNGANLSSYRESVMSAFDYTRIQKYHAKLQALANRFNAVGEAVEKLVPMKGRSAAAQEAFMDLITNLQRGGGQLRGVGQRLAAFSQQPPNPPSTDPLSAFIPQVRPQVKEMCGELGVSVEAVIASSLKTLDEDFASIEKTIANAEANLAKAKA